MESPTTADLSAVSFNAAGHGYAAGENGTLLRFDGVRWILLPSPTDQALWAVHTPLDRFAIAVGDEGTIVTVHGDDLQLASGGSGTVLAGVFARGTDSAWAVGTDADGGGLLLSWNGDTWARVAVPGLPPLLAVSGVPNVGAPVVVASASGQAWWNASGTWALMRDTGPRRLFSVHADTPDTYAFSSNGSSIGWWVLGSWHDDPLPGDAWIFGLADAGIMRVVAVGDRGTILAGGSGAWTELASPVTVPLWAVARTSPTGPYCVVGSQGAILWGTLP